MRGRSGDQREREGDGEGASVSVSVSVSVRARALGPVHSWSPHEAAMAAQALVDALPSFSPSLPHPFPLTPPPTHTPYSPPSPFPPLPPHLSCWLSAASFFASLLLSCSLHTAISQRDSFTSLARTTLSRAICLRARSSTLGGEGRGEEAGW